MNVQVGAQFFVEAARAVDRRSVAEMVGAWFATEVSLKNSDHLTGDELERVVNAQHALQDSILETPSKSQSDFVAKVRFAIAMTVHDSGCWQHEAVLLASLAYECADLCERDNDGERATAEKAGSFAEYFRLIGMPMPEPTAA
jgi:hypothetical protein